MRDPGAVSGVCLLTNTYKRGDESCGKGQFYGRGPSVCMYCRKLVNREIAGESSSSCAVS